MDKSPWAAPHELERRVSSHGRQLKPIDDQPPPREMASEGLSNRLDPLSFGSLASCLRSSSNPSVVGFSYPQTWHWMAAAKRPSSVLKQRTMLHRKSSAGKDDRPWALPFPEQSLLVGMRLVYRCLSLAGKLRRQAPFLCGAESPVSSMRVALRSEWQYPLRRRAGPMRAQADTTTPRLLPQLISRSVKPNAPLPARRSELHIELLNLFRLGTRPSIHSTINGQFMT